MLYITGKADPLNLIEGGVPKLFMGAGDKVRAKPKPPMSESILRWAKALGSPVTSASVSDATGVRTKTYGPGRDGAEVVYINVDGFGKGSLTPVQGAKVMKKGILIVEL